MKEECKKEQNKNRQRQKGARGTAAIAKGWEINDFVLHLGFVLSRKIINIYNDIARKYGNVIVKYFRKYEKLE